MIPNNAINRKGRPTGSTNKVGAELKKAITQKASELIDAINVSSLNTNQKIAYLKTVLPYAVTKQLEIEPMQYKVEVVDTFKELTSAVIDWQ